MANLVQKIEIVSLSWNLVPKLIWTRRVQWSRLLFCFRPKTSFLDKFGPTIQNCFFKVKFGSQNSEFNAEFNGDVHFFCYRTYFVNFVQNLHLAFWSYVIKTSQQFTRIDAKPLVFLLYFKKRRSVLTWVSSSVIGIRTIAPRIIAPRIIVPRKLLPRKLSPK